jgi:hypothetical protein
VRKAKLNSLANTVKTAKFKATAKFTYFSITALAVIFYLAGVAKAETPANNNPIRSTFSQLTVNSMAASPTGMSAAIPPQAQAMFGGLTKVNCRAGQAPSTCLPLGFLNTAFGIGKFTPQTAASAAGKPALTGSETLATATPWLGKITVKDALAGNPSLAAVLPKSAFVSGGSGGGRLVDPNLQNTPFGSVVNLKGARIISGDSLQVRGGKGLLAWVNGGKEPTGIHFAGMKFVVRNVNAKQGTATVNLNFRSCFYAFGEHCTPFFIGFPLWQLSERRNSFPLITTDASVVRLIRLQK